MAQHGSCYQVWENTLLIFCFTCSASSSCFSDGNIPFFLWVFTLLLCFNGVYFNSWLKGNMFYLGIASKCILNKLFLLISQPKCFNKNEYKPMRLNSQTCAERFGGVVSFSWHWETTKHFCGTTAWQHYHHLETFFSIQSNTEKIK